MDKYMRAAKRIGEHIVNFDVSRYVKCTDNQFFEAQNSLIANIIREELERPEPLIPGVRYRNTEANRKRATDNDHVVHTRTGPNIGYLSKDTWMVDDEGNFAPCKNDEIDWFALIPEGEVRDE